MADQYTYDAIFNDVVDFLKQYGDSTLGKTVNAALISAIKHSSDDIRAEYERERDIAKDNFMQYKKEPLDRHKCVSCFMVAFLRKLSTST